MTNSKEVTLYFYKLDRLYGANNKVSCEIRCTKQQAVEKAKSYTITYKCRHSDAIYSSRVLKSDIGRIYGVCGNQVILTEPDTKKAQEIFREYYLGEENRIKEELAKNKAILDTIDKMTE